MRPKTWTVKITVDPVWLEDGFDLAGENSEDWCQAIAEALLPYAYDHEIQVRVVRPVEPQKGE